MEKLICFSGKDSVVRHISSTHNHASSNAKVILDVGCGKGDFFLRTLLNVDTSLFKISYTVGSDIFLTYLFKAKAIYNDVLRCNVRFLPLRDASCDLVIASQIIEHLKKNDGLTLVKDLERISAEAIIITTPVCYNPKQHLEDNNPWQMHQSTWHPDEFKKRGFKVYGYAGARFLRGERGEFKIKSKIIEPFLFIISLLTQFIVQKLVTASYQMLCIKWKPKHNTKQAITKATKYAITEL